MEVSLRLFRAGGIDHIMSVVSSSVLSQFGCVVTLRQAASCCQCSLCANGSSSRYHGGLGVLHWCFYSVVLILVLCVTVSDVQGSAFSAAKKKKKSMTLPRGGVEAQRTSLCNLFKGNGANGLYIFKKKVSGAVCARTKRNKKQDGEFSTLNAKQNVNSSVIFYCFVLRVLVVDFTS